MNQQPSENEIEKLLEYLNNPNQTDIMRQQLFFIQTEAIRQQRINDERIIEALMNIAANNPSLATRKEAIKTLKYLGINPPSLPERNKPSWNIALLGGISALVVAIGNIMPILGWEGFQASWICIFPFGFGVVGGYLGQAVIMAILKKQANQEYVVISALVGGVIMGVIPSLIL